MYNRNYMMGLLAVTAFTRFFHLYHVRPPPWLHHQNKSVCYAPIAANIPNSWCNCGYIVCLFLENSVQKFNRICMIFSQICKLYAYKCINYNRGVVLHYLVL